MSLFFSYLPPQVTPWRDAPQAQRASNLQHSGRS